jgi:hypothetical protein
MRVGPGEAHEMQLFALDSALDLLGLPSLIVGPESMPFDEAVRLCHHCDFRD